MQCNNPPNKVKRMHWALAKGGVRRDQREARAGCTYVTGGWGYTHTTPPGGEPGTRRSRPDGLLKLNLNEWNTKHTLLSLIIIYRFDYFLLCHVVCSTCVHVGPKRCLRSNKTLKTSSSLQAVWLLSSTKEGLYTESIVLSSAEHSPRTCQRQKGFDMRISQDREKKGHRPIYSDFT